MSAANGDALVPPALPVSLAAMRRAACVVVLAGASLSPSTAQATESCESGAGFELRGGTLRLENDLFAGTDQNYTNGVSATLVSQDRRPGMSRDCLPGLLRVQARLIDAVNPGFWAGDPTTTRENVVVKFGQSMYTPEDYARTDLIENDRPYAGLLYVGSSWNRRHPLPTPGRDVLDTREVTFGVIGPLSLAEQSQTLVHDLIGEDRFHGWEHQLENEPAFQVAADRKVRYRSNPSGQSGAWAMDQITTRGFRFGNIETSATLSWEGRFGWNLPDDFGTYPIRPGAENRSPMAAGQAESPDSATFFGGHFFVLLEAKAVGYDFSLDGNLFEDSHSVSRRPLVGQAAIGFALHGSLFERRTKLAVMRVFKTREFDEQESRHAYGSIALSVDLWSPPNQRD